MNKLYLLDCTLRDGGYLNDWKFGSYVLTETAQRLINSGVDYIELGFIDDRRSFDKERSIFPNTKSINVVYKNLIINSKTKLVGMIDFGTCDLKNIDPKKDSILDGIRVIFKKEKMVEALQYCGEIKKLGYEVFTQLVSATAYEKEDFERLIKIENDLNPTCVSIVDTYGLMDNNILSSIFNYLDKGLNSNIAIGFHGHNNLQLAFSNVIHFLSFQTNRTILVDGTLMGMGKSAGNAPIELIAYYCNTYYKKKYVIDEMLEAIDSNIVRLYGKNNWGYSLKFLLASLNKVHPNYVNDYISKNILSISDINDLLATLQGDSKLLYSKDVSELAFINYCENHFKDNDDLNKLSAEIKDKKILLLGPSDSLLVSKDRIEVFFKDPSTITISVNVFNKDFVPDYLFLSNSRRLDCLANDFDDIEKQGIKIIATSNLKPYFNHFDFVFEYSSLLDHSSLAKDSAIVMALELIKRCRGETIYLAGFDGYSSFFEENFVNLSNSYGWKEPYPGFLNSYIRDKIKDFNKRMHISFITPSLFEDVD